MILYLALQNTTRFLYVTVFVDTQVLSRWLNISPFKCLRLVWKRNSCRYNCRYLESNPWKVPPINDLALEIIVCSHFRWSGWSFTLHTMGWWWYCLANSTNVFPLTSGMTCILTYCGAPFLFSETATRTGVFSVPRPRFPLSVYQSVTYAI